MQAIAKFAAYGSPSDSEIECLDRANAFREALVALLHQRHKAFVDLRNELFPELFTVLAATERHGFLISDCERRIKAHHSDVRDRNAVPHELDAELERLRAERKLLSSRVKSERERWTTLMRDFRAWWRPIADWKNVKVLDRRKEMYAAIVLPAEEGLRRYAELWMKYDLAERDVYQEHRDTVHPATRGEIVEASQPKIGKSGPGTRYEYGREPRRQPWEKLTLQFAGGLSFDDAIAGANRQLRIEPIYTNEHDRRDDETVYRVVQQIGTAANPCSISYVMKAHRSFPRDCVIQRWSLVVRQGKRYVTPIIKETLLKPTGDGVFGYKLRWTQRSDGVLVCELRGDHIHEDVVLPWPIVRRRMARDEEDAACDQSANGALSARGVVPETGARQGVDALAAYCSKHPADLAGQTILANLNDRLARATRIAAQAARCIEDIYCVVARRVCRLHHLVRHDSIALDKRKLYDGRDLLAKDAASVPVRRMLSAVAPGKLRERIKRNGLTVASDEAPSGSPGDARKTDLFTSWVKELGRKTGPQQQQPNRRSQHALQETLG